jgi:2,3-bisphosphoglycerate-dependent phosphoglycerate mutase
MPTLVLLRHGESAWNRENRFTGWTDVDLSEKGVEEAKEAGRSMAAEQLRFDVAFTSYLRRAIRTLWLALEAMDQMYVPVVTNWRLNERHYGGLQGLNKAETAAKFGADQVKLWRRSYDVRPPPLDAKDPRSTANDPRYAKLAASERPLTENLADTVARFLPCWEQQIAPALRSGQTVLVAAHGNSLRALVMHLEKLSKTQVVELEIPTGVPRLYDLDAALAPKSWRYLGRTR